MNLKMFKQEGTGEFTTITEEITFTQRFGEGDFGQPLQRLLLKL